MNKRIGKYGDKDGKGFVKPQVTVTGGRLQNNVSHNTRGIGGIYFVYLDIHKNPNTEKAIEEVKASLSKPKSASKVKTNETK